MVIVVQILKMAICISHSIPMGKYKGRLDSLTLVLQPNEEKENWIQLLNFT